MLQGLPQVLPPFPCVSDEIDEIRLATTNAQESAEAAAAKADQQHPAHHNIVPTWLYRNASSRFTFATFPFHHDLSHS